MATFNVDVDYKNIVKKIDEVFDSLGECSYRSAFHKLERFLVTLSLDGGADEVIKYQVSALTYYSKKASAYTVGFGILQSGLTMIRIYCMIAYKNSIAEENNDEGA